MTTPLKLLAARLSAVEPFSSIFSSAFLVAGVISAIGAEPAGAEPITIKDRNGNIAVVEQGPGSKVRPKAAEASTIHDTAEQKGVEQAGKQQGGMEHHQPAAGERQPESNRGESYGEENDLGTTGDQDDLDILRDESQGEVFEDEHGNVANIEQDDAPPASFGPPPID